MHAMSCVVALIVLCVRSMWSMWMHPCVYMVIYPSASMAPISTLCGAYLQAHVLGVQCFPIYVSRFMWSPWYRWIVVLPAYDSRRTQKQEPFIAERMSSSSFAAVRRSHLNCVTACIIKDAWATCVGADATHTHEMVNNCSLCYTGWHVSSSIFWPIRFGRILGEWS